MAGAATPHRHTQAALAIAVIAFGATGCGTERRPVSAPPATTAPAATGTAAVSIDNYAYVPATVSVKVGATITIRNLDATAHTLTAGDNHSFDSGSIAARSGTATIRLTRPGKFPYICSFHPFMHGTVLVVA